MRIKQNMKIIQSEREREVAGLYSGMLTKVLQLYHICIYMASHFHAVIHLISLHSVICRAD